MKIVKTGLLVILFFLGVNISAQQLVSFGIKGGAALSDFSGDGDTKRQVGLNVGVTLDYSFSKKRDWFLLTGLEYVTKGARMEESITITMPSENVEVKSSVNLGYLQLPARIGYRTQGSKLIFYGGPYVAYGVSGKYKYSGRGFDEKIDVFGDNQLKKFDFGAGIGVKAQLLPIEISFGWDFGLTNIRDGDFDIWLPLSVKNDNGYLTVGYKF